MVEEYGKFYGGVIFVSLAPLSGAAQPLVRRLALLCGCNFCSGETLGRTIHSVVPVCLCLWCSSQTRAQEGMASGKETSEDLKIFPGLKKAQVGSKMPASSVRSEAGPHNLLKP